ncbi:MAG TPA: neutral/alkaline non-lysosomal ceramidase N-terminal domain-containing protein [bacterium]|nr:neutral/alkaline non-lysosomal ceramidase N-terminal domain-containing protein [bacterium]
MVKIGFGHKKVTPPVGSGLIGYFETRISKGVKDDLYARSICFDGGEKPIFVVSTDFCWVEPSVVDRVKQLISERLGIVSPDVVIHGTHTHTGPLTSLNRQLIYTENIPVDEKYIEQLPVMICNAIEDSYKFRKDVLIGFGCVEVEGISFIRRYRMKNGTVITNPVDRSQIVEPSGEIDKTLNIMKVTDDNNNLVGISINFALHPDTVGGDLISGDWPGMLAERCSKYFGCEAVFFNGAAGDINHINPYDSATRTPEITEKIVQTLFENIKIIVQQIECVPIEKLAFSRDIFKMPKRKITEQQIEQAKQWIQKYPTTNLRAIVGRALLKQAEINANFLNNDVALLSLDRKMGAFFMSGEPFSSIGLKIKSMMNFDYKWVVENCNGFAGYIPDERAFKAAEENKKIKGEEFPAVNVFESIGMEASYETSPIPCRVAPDVEKAILSQFQQLLERHKKLI